LIWNAAPTLDTGRRSPPAKLGFCDPSLVRGYDVGSFDIDDCPEISGPWESFERLVGSRLAQPFVSPLA
jgi:hypothetical protein